MMKRLIIGILSIVFVTLTYAQTEQCWTQLPAGITLQDLKPYGSIRNFAFLNGCSVEASK